MSAAFYLLLSGSEVATQRSFIMIAIVLIGVMVDRPTLTFRTLTVAALGVLLLQPESVVHPSFQMSFAATLALIAAYQYGLPWRAKADTSFGARVALWGGREIAGLILASLVAGLAILNVHHAWTRDWRSLITAIGWIMTLAGVYRIIGPQFVNFVCTAAVSHAGFFTGAGIVLLTLGGFLTFKGYAA